MVRFCDLKDTTSYKKKYTTVKRLMTPTKPNPNAFVTYRRIAPGIPYKVWRANVWNMANGDDDTFYAILKSLDDDFMKNNVDKVVKDAVADALSVLADRVTDLHPSHRNAAIENAAKILDKTLGRKTSKTETNRLSKSDVEAIANLVHEKMQSSDNTTDTHVEQEGGQEEEGAPSRWWF